MYEGREESRFIRRPVPITNDFGMHRNWWVRNAQLTGNPLSIYLYLLSHDERYEITPRRVMRDLGLGRTAFTSARRVLEEMGFLRTETVRHPAGARDHDGRSIAGQVVRIDFILDDPPGPPNGPIAHLAGQDAGFVHQLNLTPAIPADPAIAADARNLTTAQQTPAHPAAADLHAATLTAGSAPLRENQDQEDQQEENQDDDDDARLDASLHAIDPRLDLATLTTALNRFAPGLAYEPDRMVRASAHILRRATRLVGDPAAYIAQSIAREPARWLTPRTARPATEAGARGCSDLGHRYVGEWNEICARCGTERPGWRDDRDHHHEGDIA